MSSWPKDKAYVSMTWPHAALGHQMSLLGGTSHLKFISNCVSTAFSIAFSRMSRWLYVVLLLATRCLYQGGTDYLKFWTNCVSNAFSIAFSRMSRWLYVVLLLATRCLYWDGGQLIWEDMSSENMSSLWNLLLLHRGLFHKRSMNKKNYNIQQ